MTIAHPNGKSRIDKMLRWMRDNVIVTAGVYQTRRTRRVRIDQSIRINRDGEVTRRRWERPADCGGWILNSPLALLSCCYIAALGKVASKGGKDRCDRAVFETFLVQHMPAFVSECEEKKILFPTVTRPVPHARHPYTAKGGRECVFTGGNEGTAVLYKTFRCGFAHSFWSQGAWLVRAGCEKAFWVRISSMTCLNVDRLAIAFLDSIEDFQNKFSEEAEGTPGLYGDFLKWLDE